MVIALSRGLTGSGVAAAALDERFKAPVRPTVQPWQYVVPTAESYGTRSMSFHRISVRALPGGTQRRLDPLVSGLLSVGGDTAQRPAVVDSPLEKGHVVLFSINPTYRRETVGTYPLVFNTIMNFDNLNAGRKIDPR